MEEMVGKRLAPESRESEGEVREEQGGLYREIKEKKTPRAFRPWLSALFFGLCVPWMEALLRLADADIDFLNLGLPRALLAGGALGVLLWLIGTLIPQKGVSRFLVGLLLFTVSTLFIIERCCRAFFGAYFQLAFMTGMTGQVAGEFMDTVLMVIWKNLWFFPLALVPFVLFLIFRKSLLPKREHRHRLLALWQLIALVVVQAAAVLLCHVGGDSNYYTVDFAANSAVPRFGLVNMLRLEGQYAIFGMPEAQLTYEPVELPEPPSQTPPSASAATSQEEEPPEEIDEPAEPVEPVVYGDNVMDIDFEALMAGDSGTLLSMDQYFSGQAPTAQNEYTGLFEGKNLIVLTAESFSTAAIDPDLTPTLYMLANSGFVFTNYYQPDWTQSTTGGEFAAMTGIIPTWVDSKTSFTASVGKAMPFALGWQFQKLGYEVTAYHNNTYTYYNRNKTHPNLGYHFIGIGNGLELANPSLWPCSDLEMMQATFGSQIESYLTTGKPFHTYYMTVSGHCNYGFGVNDMSEKNQDAVAGVQGSEQVRAYIACQLELEYALEYVVNALEAAGIAEDTVIVLTTDHYPYAMSDGDTDYYNELTGREDTPKLTSRYQNTLILWSGCMEEPVVVDTPCSAIDIVPTVSNLFGLEYDSRLLSGRDILAPDVAPGEVSTGMHIVVFADSGYGNSWITNAGTYEASTKTFTPKPGVEVGEDYVSQVKKLVQDRYTYAKYLIGQDYFRHVLPEN